MRFFELSKQINFFFFSGKQSHGCWLGASPKEPRKQLKYVCFLFFFDDTGNTASDASSIVPWIARVVQCGCTSKLDLGFRAVTGGICSTHLPGAQATAWPTDHHAYDAFEQLGSKKREREQSVMCNVRSLFSIDHFSTGRASGVQLKMSGINALPRWNDQGCNHLSDTYTLSLSITYWVECPGTG